MFTQVYVGLLRGCKNRQKIVEKQGSFGILASWGLVGASSDPKRPPRAPGGSKRPPRGPKRPPRAPKRPQEAPKRLPRGPKRPPKGPKRAPKRSPKGTKWPPRAHLEAHFGSSRSSFLSCWGLCWDIFFDLTQQTSHIQKGGRRCHAAGVFDKSSRSLVR